MPGFPLVPLFFACASIFMLTLAYLERPVESSVGLLTIAAGIPVYVMFNSMRKKNLTGVEAPER